MTLKPLKLLECKQLVGSTPKTLDGSLLPDVIPTWGPEYKIYIEFKINSWINGWGCIFSFTSLSAGLFTRHPQYGRTDVLTLNTNINVQRLVSKS